MAKKWQSISAATRRCAFPRFSVIVSVNQRFMRSTGMSRRIAIVEDEAAIRENYADVLRKQGYEVQTFSNRRKAMEAFEIRLPDLAIIDIGLEDEIDGGFTLCQALRSVSDTLPIIFLTARD